MAVVAIRQNGRTITPETAKGPWPKRIAAAKNHKQKIEPQWKENLAFAAGRFHSQYSRYTRSMVLPTAVRDAMKRGEAYTIDELTRYRMTALGELSSDDFQPNLLFANEDEQSQQFQEQANRALTYAWDFEIDADEKMLRLLLLLIDLGTAAVRCRFDPTVGPVIANVPHRDGKPILDSTEAHAYVAERQTAGQPSHHKDIHEGRIRWDVLSPFNLLVPPGINDPADFPWHAIVRPVHIQKIREEYGDAAIEVKPDDLASIGNGGDAGETGNGQNLGEDGKLEEHANLYTCFEEPSPNHPEGRKLVFAGAGLTPLEITNNMGYVAPDGTPRSGVTFFRYFPRADSFWGRSLTEVGIGPVRGINRRRQQVAKIIDNGLPYLLIEKGVEVPERKGIPLEIIQVAKGTTPPQPVPGINPGPWMQGDVESFREDLERAMGFSAASIGDNPQVFDNYSQMALAAEKDAVKRVAIHKEFRRGVAHLVEDTVHDMRRYWGPQKQIQLAGDDDMLEAETFNAEKLPDFFVVSIAKGSSKPSTEAAQLQLIRDIWQAATESQQMLPISWLIDSLQAGEPQPLPDVPSDVHAEKARVENERMAGLQEAHVLYYDPPEIHVPVHREAQVRAELTGRLDIVNLIEEHVLQHLQVHAQAQQGLAAQAGNSMPPQMPPGGAPTPPGAPPPGGTPPGQPAGQQAGPDMGVLQQAQQMLQAQDLHEHAVRKASAQATLAEKQAQQPPKPNR